MPGIECIVKVAFIGLGSNLGDSLLVLLKAWEDLGKEEGVELLELSSPYRTEPVGMASDRWFVNAAGSLLTSRGPAELLGSLMSVEKRFGRERTAGQKGYQDRILDLDLLFYDCRIIRDEQLVVPHPEMHTRLFVLYPLNEIAPDYHHPVLHKSVSELLLQRTQHGQESYGVEKMSWPGA